MPIYYFRATFPDGDHLLSHNTDVRPGRNGEIPAKVIETIKASMIQNPDVELREDTIKLLNKPGELQQAIDALRAEDPNRPLANDLGLDKSNRLLTNPEISRGIAAAQGKTVEPEA